MHKSSREANDRQELGANIGEQLEVVASSADGPRNCRETLSNSRRAVGGRSLTPGSRRQFFHQNYCPKRHGNIVKLKVKDLRRIYETNFDTMLNSTRRKG